VPVVARRGRPRGSDEPSPLVGGLAPLLNAERASGTVACLLLRGQARRRSPMYSILYIIGAIVVIIVVLKLLGLY